MKKLLLVSFLGLILILTGCAKEEIETLVYELGQEDFTTRVILEAQGERIIKQTNLTRASYSVLGISGKEEAETLKDQYASLPSGFEDIKGFDASFKFTEEAFIKEFVIDHTIISPDELGLIEKTIGIWYSEGMGLKDLTNKLERVGFVRLEKEQD